MHRTDWVQNFRRATHGMVLVLSLILGFYMPKTKKVSL